jgi:hypothetical protein
MNERSLQTSGAELVAHFSAFAQLAEAREAQLGRPLENCPTAADMWALVEIFRHLSTLSDPVQAGEVNTMMRALADFSDKYVDPESNLVDKQVHMEVEALIDDFRELICQAFPEAAEQLQQWSSLRHLRQTMRRTLYLQENGRTDT